MSVQRLLSVFAGLALALAFSVPAANAQVSNQATEMTFQQPVRVPGRVLSPGTYWFLVEDSGPNGGMNRVQIKNANGTKVIDQILTENVDPAQEGQEVRANGVVWPNGRVVLTLAEGTKGQPITLLDWYYPGMSDGHRFVYSSQRTKQLSEETHNTLTFRPGDTITIGRSLVTFG
jgi:hypothetical protein